MSATQKLEEEFLRLEQGNMTVQEYTVGNLFKICIVFKNSIIATEAIY